MEATLPAGEGCGEMGDDVWLVLGTPPPCSSCCPLYGDGACTTLKLPLLACNNTVTKSVKHPVGSSPVSQIPSQQ